MNDKVKSLFFSQYMGVAIIRTENSYALLRPQYYSEFITGWYKDGYLELRSISQLTDEECIKLATIVMENPFNRYRNIEVVRNYAITGFPYISVKHKNVRHRFEIDCTHINFSVVDMDGEVAYEVDMKPYACIDYLRSIGILLPFTYLSETNQPITLTPAEIINLGWAKIKSNEQ